MKVLHVGPHSVHIFRFIEAFTKSDVQHYFVSDNLASGKNIQAHYQIDFHSLNPFVILKSIRKVKKLMNDLKPDIVHIHQVNRMAFWVSKIVSKFKIPIVLTAWGSDVLIMPYKNSIYRFMVQSTLKRATEITADATAMIDSMKRLVPDKKYHLIQYGIELISPLPKEKIIYSNRLHEPLYRIDLIIELFAGFVKTNSDWHLKIGATGSQTEHLKAKVKSLGIEKNTSFLGWLNASENQQNYQTAMIYVSIPLSDGTSVSLMEAMSAGCIPIVSNLPANREWIENNTNGIIFSEDTTSSVFESALKIDYSQLALSNQKLIQEKASRISNVEAFYQLYKNHC